MIRTKNVFIGLGSNLGNRLSHLEKALTLIEERIGKIERKSNVYVSPPWGFEAKEDFYNAVILVRTNLDPLSVLSVLSNIEKELGRLKNGTPGYESRIIDLDIIDFDNEILEAEKLTLPHASMHLRKFVLVPLNEIAPEWEHPILKQNPATLLKRIKSDDFIKKLNETND